MILYKYLSDLRLNRIIDILKTEKFYFAEWQKLNDPMEGYFSYYLNDFENDTIKQITSGKNKLRICSLSSCYDDILMWSNYSNGHKGVCVEIDVSIDVRKIKYTLKIPWLLTNSNSLNLSPKDILTHKISKWKHEKEYRAFINNETIHKSNIGNITGLIFGVRSTYEVKEKIKSNLTNNIKLYNSEIDFKHNKVKRKLIINDL